MAVLPEVVEAVAGRAEIIVDGGFLRGADIVKAMALGANAVGIGRLQGLALGAGGEGALVRALELLEDEMRRCLGLLGVTSCAELDKQLRRARRAAAPRGLGQRLPAAEGGILSGRWQRRLGRAPAMQVGSAKRRPNTDLAGRTRCVFAGA